MQVLVFLNNSGWLVSYEKACTSKSQKGAKIGEDKKKQVKTLH